MSSKPPIEVEEDDLILQPSNPGKLYEECLLEILSWLPAKHICKLKCLSKNTYNLYSDHLLIKLQTLRSSRTDSGIFVHNSSFSCFKEFFLDSSSGVPPESIEFIIKESKKIVASSNGLIVFQTDRQRTTNRSSIGDLCVFNLVLQTLAPISSPVDISLDDEPRISAVCNSAGDGVDIILKAIDDSGRRNIDFENPVFVRGSIYWASDTGSYMKNTDPYILVFHVEKRTSELIPLPDEAQKADIDNYKIAVAPWTNKSLCLIQCIDLRKVVIWVMESSLVCRQGSWMKAHEVNLVIDLGLQGDGNQTLNNYTVINGELLVFTIGDRIYTYGLKDRQMNKLGEHSVGLYPQIWPYANTLHPCGR